jgi:hypothetical protein
MPCEVHPVRAEESPGGVSKWLMAKRVTMAQFEYFATFEDSIDIVRDLCAAGYRIVPDGLLKPIPLELILRP